MSDRSHRILWLIQHRTLMQAEVPILRALGYEVFVPKVFTPASHHRSSAVSFEYDESLTIPEEVLSALNEVDFYTEGLDDQIVDYINEYFGAAFFIVLEALHINAMRYFRGPLVMRAFGVVEPQSYYRALGMWGRGGIELVSAVRERFWFGACYPPLAAIEPPLLAERDVYLPLALAERFTDRYSGSWRGGQQQILFVCPDIEFDEKTRRTYTHFKSVYGDLPHVIVGRQMTPVDDPHVRGFVTEEELIDLMQTSAAMVYTSREPRMMQYPPVESAVIGLPVVFYRDSLLGSLLEHPPLGAIQDDSEGRALVERLIEGDRELSREMRADQSRIATVFSETWCERIWAENLESSGIGEAIRSGIDGRDVRDLDLYGADTFVAPELVTVPGEPSDTTSIGRGIDFARVNLSRALSGTHGLGEDEEWGRWALGDRIVLRMVEPVAGAIEVEIRGGAVHQNWHRKIDVRLGDARGSIYLSNWILPPRSARVVLHVTTPADVLTIVAPEVFVAEGGRPLSFGISRLRARPVPRLPVRATRRAIELADAGSRRLARTLRVRRLVTAIRSLTARSGPEGPSGRAG